MYQKIHSNIYIREKTLACESSNEYDGQFRLRVSAIFVILIGSMGGTLIPIFLGRLTTRPFGRWIFFVCKYFGSGVIIATAYIHLLVPALDALMHPCLQGVITEYPWVEGIVLMSIFCLFYVELLITRYGKNKGLHTRASSSNNPTMQLKGNINDANLHTHATDNDISQKSRDFAAQISSVLILEFGVLFHSVFIGLTLAVSGEEFITLYIVIVFHQTFEGLGLGTRLALIPWSSSKKYMPYVLGITYGLTTPIAVAIGIVLRTSYPPSAETTLLINGVFDSISAGILIYVGCIELMAREIQPGSLMVEGQARFVHGSCALMCLGAGSMALLGKWA